MANRRRKSRRAWVLRWSWSGDHAVEPYPAIRDQPVVALLHPSTGAKTVRTLVEHIHDSAQSAESDLFDGLCGHRPNRAEPGSAEIIDRDGSRLLAPWNGTFICGHNPYLEAFRATVWMEADQTFPHRPGLLRVERDKRPPPLDMRP